MINEARVKTMAQMAIFEQQEGAKCRSITRMRRHDYVTVCLLGQFFLGSFFFLLGLILSFFLRLQDEIFSYTLNGIMNLGYRIAAYYGIFMLIYLVFTGIMAHQKYNRCRKKMQKLEENYTKLGKSYRKEAEAKGAKA